MRICALLLPAVLLLATTGCTAVRQIDQWKCDTFGWCMPGVVPSYYYQYPAAPGSHSPGTAPRFQPVPADELPAY